MMENMMYVNYRPRTPKPDTMASSLVFPKSTKRKKKVSYLTFLKDIEGSADGDRRDVVSFYWFLPTLSLYFPLHRQWIEYSPRY